MNTENLVVLKSALTVTKGHTIFKANHFYRSLPDKKGSVIFGEWFDNREIKCLFELAHDRVLRDFKAIGILTEDGKPISKSLFTKLADIYTFGNGRKALKVWYFRSGRECIYGFYPMQGNQKENQTECYEWYLDIVKGNMEPIDNKDVMFGNCGIPLAYGALRIS